MIRPEDYKIIKKPDFISAFIKSGEFKIIVEDNFIVVEHEETGWTSGGSVDKNDTDMMYYTIYRLVLNETKHPVDGPFNIVPALRRLKLVPGSSKNMINHLDETIDWYIDTCKNLYGLINVSYYKKETK